MSTAIKGIILDVDGVLIGNKKGFNWPDPHPQVIEILRNLRERGIIVSLCTGKGTFAIKNIVEKAHLNNLHIGDGGAIVVDFLNNTVIQKHVIEPSLANQVIDLFQKENTYVELYTLDGYYVQKNSVGHITQKHLAILYKEPTLVDSLSEAAKTLEIVKIMPIAKNEEDKQRLISLFAPYKEKLSFQWGVHPTALPLQFGLVTHQNISKKGAALTISNTTGISLANMLGVGDGMTDWQFIELCGFKGAMGNSSLELIDLVKKGKNYFVGGDVNSNGLLDILRHFKLI